jgi:hypothetical protein
MENKSQNRIWATFTVTWHETARIAKLIKNTKLKLKNYLRQSIPQSRIQKYGKEGMLPKESVWNAKRRCRANRLLSAKDAKDIFSQFRRISHAQNTHILKLIMHLVVSTALRKTLRTVKTGRQLNTLEKNPWKKYAFQRHPCRWASRPKRWSFWVILGRCPSWISTVIMAILRFSLIFLSPSKHMSA